MRPYFGTLSIVGALAVSGPTTQAFATTVSNIDVSVKATVSRCVKKLAPHTDSNDAKKQRADAECRRLSTEDLLLRQLPRVMMRHFICVQFVDVRSGMAVGVKDAGFRYIEFLKTTLPSSTAHDDIIEKNEPRYCAVVELFKSDMTHGEKARVSARYNPEDNESDDWFAEEGYVLTRRKASPYGDGTESPMEYIWMPLGLVRLDFEREDSIVDLVPAPISIAIGGRLHYGTQDGYVGLSFVASWVVDPRDTDPDDDIKSLKHLGAGLLLDWSGKLYLGYQADFAIGEETTHGILVGVGPAAVAWLGGGA